MEVETVRLLPTRPADAYGTNPPNPDWGATGSNLLRLWPDGRGPDGEMSGADRPGPREISNVVSAQNGTNLPNPRAYPISFGSGASCSTTTSP